MSKKSHHHVQHNTSNNHSSQQYPQFPTERTIEQKILENLIALQKVEINLTEKFDKLTSQITQLLQLFEITAKSFSENPVNMVTEKDKDFLDKIDKLLEQNKVIAKGLTLMEERIRERVSLPQPQSLSLPVAPQRQYYPMPTLSPTPTNPPIYPAPAPPQTPQIGNKEAEMENEGYEPSMNKPLPKF